MSKSTDEKVTQDLIETLEDGKAGFTKAAERLVDTDRADLAPRFHEFAAQRGRFADELRQLAAQYGDHIDEEGSLAGSLHRGWMAIKDALTGDSAEQVLSAAEQGEDHAKSEYRDALEQDISAHLRTVVERQQREVVSAHDEVRALRDHAKS
ncbi:MAG TPA: PA2169 family four-helix-bundle protein [Ilumatobacter sp.]|nr:PA2169 family four-helix-bundle protein [Ilumatobacter sp.]